jgi:hypothetical protein
MNFVSCISLYFFIVSNSYGISHDYTGIPPVIIAKTGKGQFPPPPSPSGSSNGYVTIMLDTNTYRTTLVTNVDTSIREPRKLLIRVNGPLA